MQNKLQNLAGEHSDVLESLTPVVRKRVEFLREIQVLLSCFEHIFLLLFFHFFNCIDTIVMLS